MVAPAERTQQNQQLIQFVARALANNICPSVLDERGLHNEAASLRYALGVIDELNLSSIVQREVTKLHHHDTSLKSSPVLPNHEYEQGRNIYEWSCGCKIEVNPHSEVLHQCGGNDCQRDSTRESTTLYEYPHSYSEQEE